MSYSSDEVRAHWTEQARLHGQSPSASWSDHYAIDLEIREILRYLEDGHTVLDAGCANGFSSLHYATEREIALTGIDYIDAMIDQANDRLAEAGPLRGTCRFSVGDITALDAPDAAFDRVVVTRVLINLGGEEGQARALAECARVLRPGGLVLASEATIQGWSRLNALRCEWGLDPVPEPPFNRYVDEETLPELAAPHLTLREVVNFSSTYFLGTRVLKPLLAAAIPDAPDAANAASEWNRMCSMLPAWGDYGTQKLFVFAKP